MQIVKISMKWCETNTFTLLPPLYKDYCFSNKIKQKYINFCKKNFFYNYKNDLKIIYLNLLLIKLRFVFEKLYIVNHEKTCKVLPYLRTSDTRTRWLRVISIPLIAGRFGTKYFVLINIYT